MAHANTSTHNGTIVFDDNFENQTVGANPSSANTSGPGAWVHSGTDSGNTLTIQDPSTPGAFQGSQYLGMNRPGGGGAYAGRDLGPRNDGDVQVRMMVYQEDAGAFFNAGPDFTGEGQNSGTTMALDSLPNGTLQKLNGAYADQGLLQLATGGNMTYSLGVWQEWVFDFDLDADTYVLTIDGVSSEPTSLVQDRTLNFFGTWMSGTAVPSVAYFDAK